MAIDPWTRSNRDHLIVTQPTERQARARELMLRGFDLDEIAEAMGASRSTVWVHLHVCCWKRAEAERLARERTKGLTHGADSANHNRGQPND